MIAKYINIVCVCVSGQTGLKKTVYQKINNDKLLFAVLSYQL